MALFITIAGLAKVQRAKRIPILGALIIYCVYTGRWDIMLFLSGLFLAEMDLGRKEETEVLDVEKAGESRSRSKTRIARIFWVVLFIAGIYLACSPNGWPQATPGYIWLTKLVPRQFDRTYKFWQSVGAIFIVWSCTNSKFVERIFISDIAQYLGKVSYAFYIVHGPVLHTLGYAIMPNIWLYITGKETRLGYVSGFFIGGPILLFVAYWIADIFWRMVDIPCVKFARWMEGKCFVGDKR